MDLSIGHVGELLVAQRTAEVISCWGWGPLFGLAPRTYRVSRVRRSIPTPFRVPADWLGVSGEIAVTTLRLSTNKWREIHDQIAGGACPTC